MNFKANRFSDEVDAVLIQNGYINLTGDINSGMLKYLNHIIYYLLSKDKTNKKPLKLLFCSSGGSVITGLGIYDLVKGLAAKRPVHILAQSTCMSMALIVMQAATRRLSFANTTFLLHEVSSMTAGSLSTQQNEMAEAVRLQNVMDKIIAERTGMSIEKLRKKLQGPDWYIPAAEAKKLNLIDEIVTL